MKKKIIYPLLENAFNRKDIDLAKGVINKQQLTMSIITKKFEKQFANYIGSKYAVMVNSGFRFKIFTQF